MSTGAAQGVVVNVSVEGEGEALRGSGDRAEEPGRVSQLHGQVGGHSDVALRRDGGHRGRLRRGGGGGSGGGGEGNDSGVVGDSDALSFDGQRGRG